MIEIQVITNDGRIIARASHETEAMLCVDRAYQPGDRIVISGREHLLTQMDQALMPGEVYLPEKTMTWIVPIGEHRLAYAPGTFEAERHVIRARAMEEKEIFARRNVALNPADLRGDTNFYPHCTANVETRNEACFCARNVIDGMRLNTFHGEWPFQSWGIGAREDAWCRLDFGRDVEVDEMALTLGRISPMTRIGWPAARCCPTALIFLFLSAKPAIGSASPWAAISCAGCAWKECKKATISPLSPP